ncbi:MAG: diguanylate cyclase [Nitrospirae bacterium]|nr:diguanylate cyclase [Nitrospirota bacterium]
MNVLIVDDSKTTRREIIQTLRKEKSLESVLEASNGAEALKLISDKKVDLILTDLMMPVMDGFQLIETLKSDERFNGIPVILLSVRSDLEDRVKGLERGAWDFLVKPVHPVELLARIKAMLRVKALQDSLRTRIHQLERLSIIDGLTGLYNKKYLIEFLRREVNRAKRFKFMLSCIMMDVDHFKEVNDTHGHTRGDHVLKELGGLLGDLIRGYDFAARYGGDEFTLVFPQQARPDGTQGLAERVRKSVEGHAFEKVGARRPIRITVSMGITTLYPDSPDDHEALLERADDALYRAKSQGRNCIVTV